MSKYITIRVINGSDEFMRKVSNEVFYYSKTFKLSWFNTKIKMNTIKSGGLTQDNAYSLVDKLKLTDHFIIIFYNSKSPLNSLLDTTYYSPKTNSCITTAPNGCTPFSMAFEIAHQLQIFSNENAKTKIEVEDSLNPSQTLLMHKFDTIKNNIKVFYEK